MDKQRQKREDVLPIIPTSSRASNPVFIDIAAELGGWERLPIGSACAGF